MKKVIRFFLENRLVTVLCTLVILCLGLIVSPFQWKIPFLPTSPVAVDAIPDIGENQQIVFTEWKGRSPQDIEDQITYPLTTSLLGISGVKSVRSSSMFGVSSIYLIFEEGTEFYWSRSRILEKLNSLPSGLLPEDAKPSLGPDATALGQVYWYTLEGRDAKGNLTGGWDLHEIREAQDFYVKYALSGVDGVSEVASIGGFTQEYQIDVNPDALKAYNIPLHKVMLAVKNSNKDVGAKTIEINQAEYLIRGLGSVKSIEDLEKAVLIVHENIPISIQDVAHVSLGPASRRGVLDKEGAEVVGGVIVARYGANPLEVINNAKEKMKEIVLALPKKTLVNGVESQLTIVPFYDRSTLIYETLGTLEEALSLEVLITILVVVFMVLNIRVSFLIAGLLPLSVLITFVAMRYFHVEANIVALSGIAIAIGTMVDLGIILSENMVKHMEENPMKNFKELIYDATIEVSTAIITAVATTIISFIPVFVLQGAEGKLFSPLAFTKTFALLSALLVSLFILPTIAYWIFGIKFKSRKIGMLVLIGLGIIMLIYGHLWAGITLLAFAVSYFLKEANIAQHYFVIHHLPIIISILSVLYVLTNYWMPLGVEKSFLTNYLFILIIIGLVLSFFFLIEKYYVMILTWCLENKKKFLAIPIASILFAVMIWFGFSNMFSFVEKGFKYVNISIQQTFVWSKMTHLFPQIGKEFMPSLDEGSFLLMPTSMPHAGVEQNKKVLQQLDMLVTTIPEVEMVVGKMGRVYSALDPAPISMYENIINYKPAYLLSQKGHRERFKVDAKNHFVLDTKDTVSNDEMLAKSIDTKHLIKDPSGKYFRNWRSHIKSSDDIWKEIVKLTKIPGVTSAPKLQPIETRLVMLQTGMRAPMGIKVYGPSLEVIEDFAQKLAHILKQVPSVKSEAVFADRVVGKPYLQLNIDRTAIMRYGLSVQDVQQFIETAIGGMSVSTTIEGRSRFPIRVRYPRELRDDPDKLKKLLISTPMNVQVPLGDLVNIDYVKGPQMIKSENTFLLAYVLFDKKEAYAEVNVVEEAQEIIQEKIDNGELVLPSGVTYQFSGTYENQVHAEKQLMLIIPLVLFSILLILYFQFHSLTTSLMIFVGVAMSFSGAFLMIFFYNQDWFLNFSIIEINMRELFQINSINLSVAVWVGFIALFGIATDDGVLIATYLNQSFQKQEIKNLKELRETVIKAGQRRIKPAVMTSATTIIALLPVLTSTGRGSDIMIPMAIPVFGGMLFASITYFIVPVLYAIREEKNLKNNDHEKL